ncbi:MAG: hypothetical protein EZS28_002627 [Streblomastix strix]|uniref:Uncharacterized protein n=1 Tax=Streblomastix strix TaxID=222440 RepID=A0A5J4X3R1_9EUKA|nr:MAG: hypothetical protein EZS28_002627 [Streblomastix strix]
MPLTDEDTYHELRNGITGGLAITFHRYNISGITYIYKLKLEDTLQSANVMSSDYVTANRVGFDFNSLNLSVYNELQHEFIRYTGHQIYMPGIYYNFLCKCLDQQHFNIIYYDTDCMMYAVSGDPNYDYRQGFSAIAKDLKFYDKNFYKFFPDPNKDIYYEKKWFGVAYEHCDSSMIALAPKNYWLDQSLDKKEPEVIELKGQNLKLNPQINKEAYLQYFKENTVVQGQMIWAIFITTNTPFANNNRLDDSVIRTIRNAFGLDERAFADPYLMKQMVEVYNNTTQKAFDNKFIPEYVNRNEDLEEKFIKRHYKQQLEQR